MRGLWPILLLLFSLPYDGVAHAQSSAPLTSVQAVKAISNAEAAHNLPVKIEATVTYLRPTEKNLFVMENGYGVYVRFGQDIGLLPGDRIAVTGYTEPSFRPIVVAKEVRFLAHGQLPVPVPAKFEDLIKARFDSQYIQITGHVLSAALDTSQSFNSLRFRVRVPDGTVEGIMANTGKLRPEDLLEADVRMTGVAGGEYDSKMQLAGMLLDMNSWKDLEILHQPAS